MAKVLYSPGYGSGWSTWNEMPTLEAKKLVLQNEGLIQALETGEGFKEALEKFKKDYKDLTGEDFYCGGAGALKVATVSGPFRITEYDGFEGIERYSDDLFLDFGD